MFVLLYNSTDIFDKGVWSLVAYDRPICEEVKNYRQDTHLLSCGCELPRMDGIDGK